MKRGATALGWALAALAAAAGAGTAQAPPASATGRSVRELLRQAQAAAESGDAPAALASLREALALAPNSEEALAAYARVCLGTKAPVPAILALEPLARMHPAVPEYPYLLGVARLQVGDMATAGEDLLRAVDLAPDRPLPRIALGLALNQQKRYAEAKQALEETLRLAPDGPEALAALAEAEEALGETAEAERHARRALELGGGEAAAHHALGMVRMREERYPEARDAFLAALDADATSAKTHYQLSLAYARLGDDAASRRHLELYRQAQAEAAERLAELHARTGVPAGGAEKIQVREEEP